MSTYYVPSIPVPFPKLKTFDHNGVKVDEIEDDEIWLTDGTNYLQVVLNPEMETISFDGEVPVISEPRQYKGVMFGRFGANDPDEIIDAVETFFDVELISEDDKRFDSIVENACQ